MEKRKLKPVHIMAVCVAALLVFLPFEAKAQEQPEAFGDYVATIYNEQNGLPTGEANVVMQTSDGYVWIGSYGGLIRYDGTNFKISVKKKTVFPLLPSGPFSRILRDGFLSVPMMRAFFCMKRKNF